MKSKKMRWAGHVARMGKKRNLGVYSLLLGKAEGKILLGESKCELIILKWILDR
jgi:hypothetical protein